MDHFKTLITIVLLALMAFVVSSCEKKLKPTLTSEIKYVGYEYVIVSVKAEGFDDIYNDATFYVGLEPKLNKNIAQSTSYSVKNGQFYPEFLNMNPNFTYYGFAELQGVRSLIFETKCKKAEILCQGPKYQIEGDLSATQYGIFGSYNYLRHRDSYLGRELNGDLRRISLNLAYGNWIPGVYTTYKEGESFVHKPMRKNPQVIVEDQGGIIYTAKPGQVLKVVANSSYDWSLVFCDLVFEDSEGNEITLSANLAVVG